MSNRNTDISSPAKKQSKLTVFTTVFGLFLFIAILIGASTTLTNYLQLRASATEVASDTFASTIQRIDETKQSMFGVLILLTELFSDTPGVKREGGVNMDAVLSSVLRGLKINPHVFQAYAGYENGDFYQIFSLVEEDRGIIESLGGPFDTRFAVHAITRQADDRRLESWRFLDESQIEISYRENYAPSYDPRIRDWYTSARANPGRIFRTPPYVFAISPEVGISFVESFDGPDGGVFATDLTLDRFSSFLNSIRPNAQHKILVFDSEMALIAHPDADKVLKRTGASDELSLQPAKVTDLSDPVIARTVELFAQNGAFELDEFELDGNTYLASVAQSDSDGQPDYVLYAAPRSEFEGRMAEAASQGLFAGIVLILFSIPFVVILARSISKPLSRLSEEAAQIQAFQLDDPIEMHSPVNEINTLIRSMSNMKNTMRSISKFVPKALVKDILESGKPVEVGGERRNISLLFTDVQGFTPIADSMEPEELMLSMSEYFEELVGLIIADDGTVDKFVGDAIFAYWNAPLPTENYEYVACFAALKCRAASERLSAEWKKQGRIGWYTRFGVHAGDAVVGNVGSSDRIDFTAIGDPVNIASRLEGLNKFYKTSILVSGPVVEACAEKFLFRYVDRSLPKGAGAPLDIYEPIGLYDGPDEFRVSDQNITFVKDWDEALADYRNRNWVKALDAMESFAKRYSDDGVARIYLERIIEYIANPPSDDWDGIIRFNQK